MLPTNFDRWARPHESAAASDPGPLTKLDLFAGSESHLKASEIAYRLETEGRIAHAIRYGALLHLKDEDSPRIDTWIKEQREVFAFGSIYVSTSGMAMIPSVIFAGRGVTKPSLNVSSAGRWIPKMQIDMLE